MTSPFQYRVAVTSHKEVRLQCRIHPLLEALTLLLVALVGTAVALLCGQALLSLSVPPIAIAGAMSVVAGAALWLIMSHLYRDAHGLFTEYAFGWSDVVSPIPAAAAAAAVHDVAPSKPSPDWRLGSIARWRRVPRSRERQLHEKVAAEAAAARGRRREEETMAENAEMSVLRQVMHR